MVPGDLAQLSGDGRLLLIKDFDGTTLRLHDAASGAPRKGALLAHRAEVKACALSRDGRLAVSATADRAQLWDTALGLPLGPAVMPGRRLIDVGFTADGNFFLTTSADGTTLRWRVPQPTTAGMPELTLRLETLTGQRLDAGQSLVRLDSRAWEEAWRRWAARE